MKLVRMVFAYCFQVSALPYERGRADAAVIEAAPRRRCGRLRDGGSCGTFRQRRARAGACRGRCRRCRARAGRLPGAVPGACRAVPGTCRAVLGACSPTTSHITHHIRGLEPRPWHSSLLFVAVFTGSVGSLLGHRTVSQIHTLCHGGDFRSPTWRVTGYARCALCRCQKWGGE